MWTKWADSRRSGCVLATLAWLACGSAAAQPALYKYRDANGVWVFTDRSPRPGQMFQQIEVDRDDGPPVVRLYERPGAGGERVLAAANTFHGTVQIAFRIEAAENLARDVPTRGNRILSPRSDTELLALTPVEPSHPARVEFLYQYIHGHPGARHRPDEPYRLPYALASSHTVSQAWPDRLTHVDMANADAVDFEMPVGTGVYAARAGTVLDVASDYFESGLDARYASRANMVRILHADGTMGLYAHLNWNSIRVVPGQTVERGEYIADSGNTGFSSGPHLHFVVQRNIGGAVGSVPVQFAGIGNEPITLVTGDVPVAY